MLPNAKHSIMKEELLFDFKQSKNWSCIVSLQWILENASHAYTTKGYKGRRPKIVLKTPIADGINVITLRHDNDGVITDAESISNGVIPDLEEIENDAAIVLVRFLEDFGCDDMFKQKEWVDGVGLVSQSESKRKAQLILTHIWADNFGWENTVRTTEDYASVLLIGELDENHTEGKYIFIATFDDGKIEQVRGDYK